MAEDNEHSGGSPPEAPPPAAEGAARFAGMRVEPDGSIWTGDGECIDKGEQVNHPQEEQPTRIRVDDAELSIEEIRALKQEADEVRKMREEVEPYSVLLKDSRLHDLIAQGAAEGFWEAPPIPTPQPSDMGEYHRLQTTDPLFDDVRDKMISYSANLSFEQQAALNNNPTFFLKIYNAIRATAGDKPLARRTMPVDEVIRNIQRKEKAKDTAILQRPGGGDHESSDRAAERRSYKADLKLLQSGNNEDIASVLMKRVFRQGNE